MVTHHLVPSIGPREIVLHREARYLRLVSALTMDRNDVWAKRRYMIPAIQSLAPTAVTMFKRTRRRAA